MIVILISLFITWFPPATVELSPDAEQQAYLLKSVNELRAKGCRCGLERMQPVGPVKWDDQLYKSAQSHAKYLTKKRKLSHYGRRGEDISVRIAQTGYPWKVVGENLGKGQTSYPQVMKDWIKSVPHCKMLMNPKVDEMAVAKVKDIWVQHFGKKKEAETRRVIRQ
jgi:uncharacterized protein YkwD